MTLFSAVALIVALAITLALVDVLFPRARGWAWSCAVFATFLIGWFAA